MKQPDRYDIKTLEDIVALPRDKQINCVKDLAAWLEWREDNKEILAMARELGVEDANYFIWVDDDLIGECSGVSISIKDGDK